MLFLIFFINIICHKNNYYQKINYQNKASKLNSFKYKKIKVYFLIGN